MVSETYFLEHHRRVGEDSSLTVLACLSLEIHGDDSKTSLS